MQNNLAKLFSECRARIGEGGSPLLFLGFEATKDTPGCYVLINVETGKWLSPTMFEEHGEFKYGVAPVKVDGKWGFIREDGSFLVEPMYYWAGFFGDVLQMEDCSTGMTYLRSAETGELLWSEGAFDEVEFFGNRKDVYIVVDCGGCHGLMTSKGEWLTTLEYASVHAFSDELALLQVNERRCELWNIRSNELLLEATSFDWQHLKKFGVFSCYYGDSEQTEYFKLVENKVESLFIEAEYQILGMETPDIIFGTIQNRVGSAAAVSDAMFSISKKKWIFKGMQDIKYHNIDGFEYYTVFRGGTGIVDCEGNILLDVVARILRYYKGNFIVRIDGKFGVFSLAEKRLILPLADKMKYASTGDFDAYIFGKKEKCKWRSRWVYRYWVNGKFVSDYEYVATLPPSRMYGAVCVAHVKRIDGKWGWIDMEGEFMESLPGEFNLAK